MKAFAPAPERTMARISGEVERVSKTCFSSSHIGSKKALYFVGRLIWTWALFVRLASSSVDREA